MLRYGISEILAQVDDAKTKEEKIRILKENESPMLKHVLSYVFNPDIKFLLPSGAIDYYPNELTNNHNSFYIESRRLYLFIEGGHPTLSQKRREELFVYLLENIDSQDAKLMMSIKDKIMPYQSVTKNLLKEAFPDFLSEKEE